MVNRQRRWTDGAFDQTSKRVSYVMKAAYLVVDPFTQ